jgi:23S rRNA pseudouridine2605 synthase
MKRSSKRHDRKPCYGGRASRPRDRSEAPDGIRLQKILAAAGAGSRRHCEQLILEGRVEVDGQTVTELGTRVNPGRQEIRLDGQPIRRPKKLLYYLVNKPVGILSTNYDPAGRPRVVDLAPAQARLFTVGRLDKSSEGLILVTNDGRLTDLLTHPRYGVEKTYLAEVAGVPSAEALARLRRGLHLAEGFAHAKRVHARKLQKHSAILEIVLDEGRNREVRRLLARIGHKVLHLRRTAIGPLRLGNLKSGESRPLAPAEIDELYRTATQGRRRDSKPSTRRDRDLHPTTTPPDEHAAVHPIIDRSLPADLGFDDDLESVGKNAADLDHAPEVDLSPIVAGRSRRPAPRTIIGGSTGRGADQKRAQRGRRRHGRSRGRAGGRRTPP